MEAAAFAVILLALQSAVLAQQQPRSDPADSVLQLLSTNAPAFRKMLAASKITSESFAKPTVGTFFAPSDAAVKEFLKSIGYTESELLAMPILADLVTSYHFIPGHQVSLADVSGGPKVAATGDDNFIAKLSKNAAGRLTVQDVQGNVATAAAAPLTAGSLTVFTIDKVLMSGNYFTSVAAALAYYPFWSTTAAYIDKAGTQQLLDGTAGGFTLFVPDNAAFKPVEDELSVASTARLSDVLKYHVATGGIRNVPRGFRNGPLVTLLPGHDLTITSFPTNEGFNPFKQKAALRPLLRVTPEAGKDATVSLFNIYAGRNILQGINSVLMPAQAGGAKAAPAAAAAAAVATPGKVAAEAGKPAAAAAAGGSAKPAAASVAAGAGTPGKAASGRRRLLAAAANASARQLQQADSKGVGFYQTFANGVTGDNTGQAIAAAAGTATPLQYTNRFGTLEGPTATGGCLNCRKWAVAAAARG